MKKISVTTWISLAGIFLYTASLWQRPLFISEFICGNFPVQPLPIPARSIVFGLMFKYLELSPFTCRIIPALLTLLAAAAVFYAGRSSTFSNTAKGGALIFLLTPAVFLCGTSALDFMYNGALPLIALFSLFAFSEAPSWKKAILPGVFAALFLCGTLFFAGGAIRLLFALAAWGIFSAAQWLFPDGAGAKRTLKSFLPFLPALLLFFALPLAWHKPDLQLPQTGDLKTLAAFAVAGSFPWVLFWCAVLKNFTVRLKAVWQDSFTRWALILTVTAFIASLFTKADQGLFIPFLAGSAVLLAAGLEMEHAENGFRSANIILWILAGVFFLAAAAIGSWGALGLYTKLLKPAMKIFTSRDAWALTAIVPAVAAVWALTGASEKISKERKFLSLCAGTAFLLLAFHGLVPLKAVENNAPVNFLKKVVLPRTGFKAAFYGDDKMFMPLSSVFKGASVKLLSPRHDIPEITKRLKKKEKMCIVTRSRVLSSKLPFPKTTLRSGSFFAVFYNIDFPEMRVKKP